MSKRYFIGNLPYSATEKEILSAFAEYDPSKLEIIHDKLTGRPRGYAFLTCEREPRSLISIGIRRIHIGEAHGAF